MRVLACEQREGCYGAEEGFAGGVSDGLIFVVVVIGGTRASNSGIRVTSVVLEQLENMTR